MPIIRIPTSSRDHYVNNPPQKPKFEIGGYFESRGFFVPSRFAEVDEAYESPSGFLYRSEHRLEYAGPSDLFTTVTVLPEDYGNDFVFTREEWQIFQRNEHKQHYDLFPKAYGYDPHLFAIGVDFSLWELVDGINRFMFADPVNEGQYYVGSSGLIHSFDRRKPILGHRNQYSLHQISYDSTPVLLAHHGDHPSWPVGYGSPSELIDLYEMIRELNRFDPDHIPIVEFQSDPLEGIQWTLQYHRGRDRQKKLFTLAENDIPPSAIRFDHVMGSTAPDGEDVEVAIAHADGTPINFSGNYAKAEVLARSNVPVLLAARNLKTIYCAGVMQHGSRSLWAKPPLSLFIETEGKWGEQANIPISLTRNTRIKEVTPGVEIAFAPMRVVSDGNIAFATAI